MSQRKHSVTLSPSTYLYCQSFVDSGKFTTVTEAAVWLLSNLMMGQVHLPTVPNTPAPAQKSEVLPAVQQKSEVPPISTPVPLGTSEPAKQGGIDALRSLGKK